METLVKYPRTYHLEGSRLQAGDEGCGDVPFATIASHPLVVEEKVDGANSALSFGADGQMRLQSRGHYLTGGPRERHFNLFKQWAYSHAAVFWERLGDRYIVYGEWMYAKHTVFYDQLPHYFLEYDVLDLETRQFLSTPARQQLLQGLPIVSVPVLWQGLVSSHKQLTQMVGPSHYISTGHRDRFLELCEKQGLDVARSLRQSELSGAMEGLYIKVETEQYVTARYKYIRADFLQTLLESDGYWLDRPIIPNQLRSDVDLFA